MVQPVRRSSTQLLSQTAPVTSPGKKIFPQSPPLPPSIPPSRAASPTPSFIGQRLSRVPTPLSSHDWSEELDSDEPEIREEEECDRMAVNELIQEGFAESEWADKLGIHTHRIGYLVASLVSLDKQGSITGHIAASTITAVSRKSGLEAGRYRDKKTDGQGDAVLINPLVVHAGHQHHSIGTKLVRSLLDLLASGHKGRFQIAFVQGPVAYYEDVLGFSRHTATNWSVGLGGHALMAKYIGENELHGSSSVSRRVSKGAADILNFDYPDEYGFYASDVY